MVHHKPQRQVLLLLLPTVALLAGVFFIPLLWLIRLSFYDRSSVGRFYQTGTFTLRQYKDIFSDPFFAHLGWTTAYQAVFITGIVMILAYPAAILVHRSRGPSRAAALMAILLPKLTNLLVLTFGLLFLLSNSGPINRGLIFLGLIHQPIPMFANLFAVVVTELVIIAPYPILILLSAFQRLDPNLEQAARGMGAGPLRSFFETDFKLTLPAAFAAAFIAFNWALAAFIGPVAMGNPGNYSIAVQVHAETLEHSNWPLGAALGTCNALLAIGVWGTFMMLKRAMGSPGPKQGGGE